MTHMLFVSESNDGEGYSSSPSLEKPNILNPAKFALEPPLLNPNRRGITRQILEGILGFNGRQILESILGLNSRGNHQANTRGHTRSKW